MPTLTDGQAPVTLHGEEERGLFSLLQTGQTKDNSGHKHAKDDGEEENVILKLYRQRFHEADTITSTFLNASPSFKQFAA